MNMETVLKSKSEALLDNDLATDLSWQLVDADISINDVRELVIADAGIEDVDLLLGQLEPGTDLWLVDAKTDIASMFSAALSGAYSRLHILGHGQPGAITLGGRALEVEDFTLLSRRNVTVQSMHFWSCMTGAGIKGRAFVDCIAQFFEVVVTAFSGLVGAGSKGGSWSPDVFSRYAELTPVPFINATVYPHTLLVSALQLKTVETATGVDVQVWLTAGTSLNNTTLCLNFDPAKVNPVLQNGAYISGATGWSWYNALTSSTTLEISALGALDPISWPSDIILNSVSFTLVQGSSGFNISLEGTYLEDASGTHVLGTPPTLTYIVPPTLALATDSGSSTSDGITNVGTVTVSGLEANATWEYSTDSGSTWSAGTGVSFTLSAGSHSANSVQVRQTDVAGNVSSAGKIAPLVMVDTTAPVVTSFSPADGAFGVAVGRDILITFRETIVRGTGVIELHSGSATGPVVESYDVATSTHLTISGTTLTINPTHDFANGAHYFLMLGNASVKDLAGTCYPGIDAYDFTVIPDIEGINMSTYSKSGYEGLGYTSLLVNAVDAGANYVGLGSVSVIDLKTGVVSDWIQSTTGFNGSASVLSVGSAIAAAEAKGLNVFLKPQINALNPASVQYTGQQYSNLTDSSLLASNTPENTAAFFAGYKSYILQWAALAQQFNVPLLSIGNEMMAATKPEYTHYWNDIIDSVRAIYSGNLTYSALTGMGLTATNNEVAQIGFWGKLDYVGVDIYPDFPTGTATPTVAQLNAEWTAQGWKQYLANIAASTGKPIIFTETGTPSFAGSANRSLYTDALIGQPGTQRDDATQANWYQSFMNTWAGSQRPEWLAGSLFWNNDPGAKGLYYETGYSVYEKLANIILTSAFGGVNYLSLTQNSFTGSGSNDSIALYGDAVGIVHDPVVIRAKTFFSAVTITINGSIVNGVTPTVHFSVNGVDTLPVTLSNTPQGASNANNSITESFSYSVDDLAIGNFKMVMDSPVTPGFQVWLGNVTVNGTALTNFTYYPLNGWGVETRSFPWTSLYHGGYLSFDLTPYNTILANQPGTAANPFLVNGGGGYDTVFVLGHPDQYLIRSDGSGVTWLAENSGLHQNAVLSNISAITFADGSQLTGGHWSTTAGAMDVAVGNDIVLTFSTAIQKGSGMIALHAGSVTGSVFESYNVATSANLAFSGSTLTINPTVDLAGGTHYFFTFTDGSLHDISGNSLSINSAYDFTTTGAASLFHDIMGGVTFWKTGAPITGVASTIITAPAVEGSQPVEFRNIQLAADGTRTLELWETSTKPVESAQLEFALSSGSVATWQNAAGLSPGWISMANTGISGQFILGSIGTAPFSAGPVKLGTLTLTAPTNPQHFELVLTTGLLNNDTIPTFGIASDSMTTGADGLYHHITMPDGSYALTSAKVSGTAEADAVHANDALAALKMAVGMNPNTDGSAVSPYQFLAADVNKDGVIRAADALNILKMAVKLDTAPANEWLFVPESVGSESMSRTHVIWPDNPVPVALDVDQELHLIGIVKGDVDGSWTA